MNDYEPKNKLDFSKLKGKTKIYAVLLFVLFCFVVAMLSGCTRQTNSVKDKSFPNHTLMYTYSNYSPLATFVGLANADNTEVRETAIDMYQPQYINNYIYGIVGNNVVRFKNNFKDGDKVKTTNITNFNDSWLAEKFYTYGNYTYYSKEDSNASNEVFAKMYMIKNDGSGEKEINAYIPDSFYADKDGFYEVSMDSVTKRNIMKYNLDGTNQKTLNSGSVGFMNITDDWIFYTNLDDNFTLYKIDKNGNNKSKLLDVKLAYNYNVVNQINGKTFFDIIGDYIYYINVEDSNKLYKVKIDGTDNVKVYDKSLRIIWVMDNHIYFQENNGIKTMVIDADGKNEKEVITKYINDLSIIKN